MKRSYSLFHLATLVLAGYTVSFMACHAWATDLPKRKTGLWEISMVMEGAPGMGPIQQCIDSHTDNLMQQNDKLAKSDCSVVDIKNTGSKVTVHSICKFGETTAITDAMFVGSFDKAYKGDIKTRYSPSIHGRSESRISMEAKWLSPCKPGQKPGDVIMPNHHGININEMMNNPKFKEMMKREK
jgi:hypothetical protein